MSLKTQPGFVVGFLLSALPLMAGDIKFNEVAAAAGVQRRDATYGAAFADIDEDGWVDLYVGNHAGGPPSMFINNGDGTFRDNSSVLWGGPNEDFKKDRHGMGFADFDNDGDRDVYHTVGAGRGTKYKPDDLYRNNGLDDFEQVAVALGADDGSGRGRGVAWGDYDHDGDLDLFIATQAASAGGPTPLFRNNADGTFTNVAKAAGVELFVSASGGVTWVDYDGDGWVDLLVTVSINKDFPNRLFRNDHDGTFTEVTKTAFTDRAGLRNLGRGAAWGDYDNDGDFDLLITRSRGDRGDFGEGIYMQDAKLFFLGIVSKKDYEDGVDFTMDTDTATFEFPFFPTAADYEAPLPPEVFIGRNKKHPTSVEEFTVSVGGALAPTGKPRFTPGSNQGVYIWKDGEGWHVRIVGKGTEYSADGVIKPVGGQLTSSHMYKMEDYDTDVTNRLYRNNGNGTLTDVTAAAGIVESYLSGSGIFADFDNDGDLDIFVMNVGFCVRGVKPYSLFSNNGDGTFTEVTSDANFKPGPLGNRGVAVAGDYDNDGKVDVFVTGGFGPPPMKQGQYMLYRNTTNAGNWLEIRLVGTASNRDGYGAHVKVKAQNTFYHRFADGGFSLHSQNSSVLHFGLGNANVAGKVTVYWPSGIEQVLDDVPLNQVLTITEP
jgi:ASPIC/UnbV protein/VCBS repeat protein